MFVDRGGMVNETITTPLHGNDEIDSQNKLLHGDLILSECTNSII